MIVSSHQQPGLIVNDHQFDIPLDHTLPGGATITVFARELIPVENPECKKPYIVYLQGGPGFECRAPVTRSGWINTALQKYRVLLIDQRGTGNSSPISNQTLSHLGGPREQAQFLSLFRADSIVKDFEYIRKQLIGDRKWTILGQSFGGFCAVHSLCVAPEGLEAVMITGGLPPLSGHADKVYEKTSKRVINRNKRYYNRYSNDKVLVKRVVEYLDANHVLLPSGTILTPRVFQQLGMGLGRSTGFETLHYLLESAFVNGEAGPELSYRFLRGVENQLPFETNPIYALLHEAIYCQNEASNWSAYRITNPIVDYNLDRDTVYFTGEMVFPWMFEDYKQLRSLATTAEILAQKSDWANLYDAEILQGNQVPCAAVVYDEDMYVERKWSVQTAEMINGLRIWTTNEYDHNGLGVDGSKIFEHLSDLVIGNR